MDFISGASTIDAEFIADVTGRLASGKPVRRRLPESGRLHIDRRLPFLCVYRIPPDAPPSDAPRLAMGEAAYLIASGERQLHAPVARLVRAIADVMIDEFGAFLLLELWTGERTPGARGSAARGVRRPTFRIQSGTLASSDPTVRSLHRALAAIPLRPPPLDVEVVGDRDAGAPGFPSLFAIDGDADAGTDGRDRSRYHQLGIEVQPVYRQARTGTSYPALFTTLRRGLSVAIKQTAYHFSITHTTHQPPHYHALGRRLAVSAAAHVDRELTEIASSFDFLLQVTPVNTAGAQAEFERHGAQREPVFDYRPLVVDGDALKRRLFDLPIDRLEDPTLAHLLSDSRTELDRKITMLGDRGTPRFLYGSLSVYGSVEPTLLTLARTLLARLHPTAHDDDDVGESDDSSSSLADGRVDAATFAERALAEIERYRTEYPELAAQVLVRDDVTGLLVTSGDLLIGRRLRTPAARVEALVQHEIGTHVVTYYNGLAQPLSQLAHGLAGYEELQEGLAVLSEHLVGGLNSARMRMLAARVVAARHVIDGASFIECYRDLIDTHGFGANAAFSVTARVFRSGGLTKDVVYLRGLVQLLSYLKEGGELEPLYIGKIALVHLPIMQELRWREYLRAAPLSPRYLTAPGAADRMRALRAGRSVLDLLPGTAA